MTLEEAIIHCEEVASKDCSECALEHRQLAVWLRELKSLKEIQKKVKIVMDYKEKYEQAMLRMRDWIEDPRSVNTKLEAQKIAEIIFPELGESEDERIRRAIIDELVSSDRRVFAGYSVKAVLAWLEKQKPRCMWNNTKDTEAPSERDILGWYRNPDGTLEGSPKIVWFCSQEEANKETQGFINTGNLAYWSELPNEDFKKRYWFEKQKPVAWSEEDYLQQREAIEAVVESNYGEPRKEATINWLKSLRPQPMVEWSEEDEAYVKMINNGLEYSEYYEKSERQKLADWLKSLKQRIKAE